MLSQKTLHVRSLHAISTFLCAEVNIRGRNQWQTGGDRQRTWTPQENQENINKSGYRGTEMSQMEKK